MQESLQNFLVLEDCLHHDVLVPDGNHPDAGVMVARVFYCLPAENLPRDLEHVRVEVVVELDERVVVARPHGGALLLEVQLKLVYVLSRAALDKKVDVRAFEALADETLLLDF